MLRGFSGDWDADGGDVRALAAISEAISRNGTPSSATRVERRPLRAFLEREAKQSRRIEHDARPAIG